MNLEERGIKNRALATIGFLLTILLLGCTFQGGQGIIELTGTVKYVPLEGGFYGVVTDKGEKYYPLNLPDEFREDGLRINFKAKVRKDVVTIQMWVPVEILKIEKLPQTQQNQSYKELEVKAKEKLRRVRVASLYERITDGAVVDRSTEEMISLFKETRTDFIFRAFWRWNPCPNKCNELSSQKARWRCEFSGYSYEKLEKTISEIKAEMPDVIICGAVPAQIIHRGAVWNPETGEIIGYPQTWDLALDPQKWGVNVSKEEFQCEFGKKQLWVSKDLDCSLYSPEEAAAYFPDITNPRFQRLLISWAEKQIDAGADAIWVDMLFAQANLLLKITKNINHSAVKESYEAACKIVDEIHDYGKLKGKYVYVGSWLSAAMYPYSPPNLDFVTLSPSVKEVKKMELDEEKWSKRLDIVKQKLGNVPVFAFIDWAATTKTPLGVFSQNLSKEEQRMFLTLADNFFTRKEVTFVYPIHGGTMGVDAKILSFDKFKIYDSLAPEFQTYETIKHLAQNKRS